MLHKKASINSDSISNQIIFNQICMQVRILLVRKTFINKNSQESLQLLQNSDTRQLEDTKINLKVIKTQDMVNNSSNNLRKSLGQHQRAVQPILIQTIQSRQFQAETLVDRTKQTTRNSYKYKIQSSSGLRISTFRNWIILKFRTFDRS